MRVPIRLAEQMTAVRRVQEELMQRLGRPPTAAELARETGIDEPVIEDLRRAERIPASLCEPVGADGDSTLADLIPDDAQPDPAVQAEAAHRLTLVAEALGALDERPRRVIELRYGVNSGDPWTLDEVAGESRPVARARPHHRDHRAAPALGAPGARARRIGRVGEGRDDLTHHHL